MRWPPDLAELAVALGLRLRRAGVVVGLMGIEAFVRGLAACPPDSLDSLYWVARVTLVKRAEDLEAFEEVFAEAFSGITAKEDLATRGQRGLPGIPGEDSYTPRTGSSGIEEAGLGLPWTTLPKAVAQEVTEVEPDLRLPERLASSIEAVADVPFEALDHADLALLDHWLTAALRSWPRRRARRLGRHHAGHQVSLRPTLARARRTGFEAVELVRTRPLQRTRPVVMLCDVSESMQHQAAAYFHLMRAVARTTDAEVFAFATRLTRLTPVLAQASAELAIEQATAKVADRFGGTRIASNLRALLSSSRGNACRGAIVVVASDGWDADPPEQLAKAMAKLRRRAYRVIWLNPRVAAPHFAPEVGAMAAALPYVDDLLPANTIRSLADVVSAIVVQR